MEYRKDTAGSFLFGPFIDQVTSAALSTLTIANTDIYLSKNGAVGANPVSSTVTYDKLGYYKTDLPISSFDTAGKLKVFCHKSPALPVWENLDVISANEYDRKYGDATVTLNDNNSNKLVISKALKNYDASAIGETIDSIYEDIMAASRGQTASLSTLTTNLSVANGKLDTIQSTDLAQSASLVTLTTNIATANGKLDVLQSTDTTQNASLVTLTTNLDTVVSRTATLLSNDTSQSASLSTLTTNMSTVVSRTSTLLSNDTSQSASLNTLTTNVNTLLSNDTSQSASLVTITTNTNTIISKLPSGGQYIAGATSLQNLDDAIDAAFIALTTITTDTKNNTTTLLSNDNAQSASLVTLTTNVGTANTKLDTLQSNDISQSASLTTLTTNMSTVVSRTSTLLTNDTNQNNSLSTLTTNLAAANVKLDTLQSNDSSQSASLSTLTTSIAYITGKLPGSGQSIAGEVAVQTIDDNVDILVNGLSTVTVDLNTLTSDVEIIDALIDSIVAKLPSGGQLIAGVTDLNTITSNINTLLSNDTLQNLSLNTITSNVEYTRTGVENIYLKLPPASQLIAGNTDMGTVKTHTTAMYGKLPTGDIADMDALNTITAKLPTGDIADQTNLMDTYNKVNGADIKIDNIVSVLPSGAAEIASQVYSVAIARMVDIIGKNKFKFDFPSAGQITFYEEDGITQAFTVQIETDGSRTPL